MLLGVAVLCGIALPSAAHGQDWEQFQFSQPRETGDRAVSDGRRWAGYELLDGSARLIDTATGRILTVQPPRHCRRTWWFRGLRAIGAGQALWHCRIARGTEAWSIRLFDIAHRRWHVPAAPRRDVYCLDRVPEAVGRWWLSETCFDRDGYSVIYTNWRNGKVRHDANWAPFPRSPTAIADLNARDGVTRLCDPLNRSELPQESGSYARRYPKYYAYLYDGRRAISGDFEEGLVVQGCGGETLLARSGRVESVQLGAGLVSWLDADGYIRAFRFSDRRGFEANHTASVVHTRHALYASETKQIDGHWRTFTSVAGIPPPLP